MSYKEDFVLQTSYTFTHVIQIIIMAKEKEKTVIFRAETPLYNFVQDFARANGMTVSEHCRNVMIYFHTGMLAGEFRQSLPLMKKTFEKTFGSRMRKSIMKEMKSNLRRKYNPKKIRRLLDPF
jgi:hypothetical protein